MGPRKTCGFFCCKSTEIREREKRTMFNLTITIWPIIDENDPETQSVMAMSLKDQDQKKLGIGTSPPDK